MVTVRMAGALLAALLPLGALAQEGDAPAPARGLAIELNTLDPQPGACRLTFVARNTLGVPLEALVLETVLFTREGRVAQFTLFDFGALPEGSRRVRQFDLAGQDCEGLGQVLFNGVARCDGPGEGACAAALAVSSQTGVGVEK